MNTEWATPLRKDSWKGRETWLKAFYHKTCRWYSYSLLSLCGRKIKLAKEMTNFLSGFLGTRVIIIYTIYNLAIFLIFVVAPSSPQRIAPWNNSLVDYIVSSWIWWYHNCHFNLWVMQCVLGLKANNNWA